MSQKEKAWSALTAWAIITLVKPCRIAGCGKAAQARDFCRVYYAEWYLETGKPRIVARRSGALIGHFAELLVPALN